MAEREEPAIVRVADAELDITTRTGLRVSFQRVASNSRLIVDLTRTQYMDSTAIDELYRAEQHARQLGGKLVIIARNQRIVRLMSIAGLTERVTIVDTLDAALAEFG